MATEFTLPTNNGFANKKLSNLSTKADSFLNKIDGIPK